MLVPVSRNVGFSQKCLFPHPGTLVFVENGCSRIPERLFFSKMLVPASRNACFSQKWLFPPLGTLVFVENGCSCTREYCPEVRTAVSRMRFFVASGFLCTLRGGFRKKTICRAEQGGVLPGKLFVVSKNDSIPVLTAVRA